MKTNTSAQIEEEERTGLQLDFLKAPQHLILGRDPSDLIRDKEQHSLLPSAPARVHHCQRHNQRRVLVDRRRTQARVLIRKSGVRQPMPKLPLPRTVNICERENNSARCAQ